jgi:hypothetical protein
MEQVSQGIAASFPGAQQSPIFVAMDGDSQNIQALESESVRAKLAQTIEGEALYRVALWSASQSGCEQWEDVSNGFKNWKALVDSDKSVRVS